MALPLLVPGRFVPYTPDQSLKLYRDAWSNIEDLDTVWLITWNPKPRFYNYDGHRNPEGDYDNDYDMQWRTMQQKLLTANRCLSNYAFVAEISDDGKLHMHGFMVVSDKIKYFKSFLPGLTSNGFVKKSKANSHRWKTFKYHVKDLHCTVGLLAEQCYVITPETRESMAKDLHMYKALVSHHYDQQIKKMNVMQMLSSNQFFEEDSDSSSD